ncbi:hypothetical protein [Kineococcus glutinatus]|uniref:Alpha/beta hydrolase family protein n=1 Tax=Kineococcus glutinatus TaxID=1070872 RepID=A0ABP9HYD2_9ACTN
MLRRWGGPPRDAELIARRGVAPQVLVTGGVGHSSFERFMDGTAVLSPAPFVPVAGDGDVTDPAGRVVWSRERFTALLLGEVRRLHDDEDGYGPRGAGHINHVDVPAEVLDAYRRLLAAHPRSARPACGS